ncbi:hypothetical protein TRVA0_087S00166 [Trichomonascus vanleenenianus]|uniref:uncharacterized protein n=1 Tax=Trichomonascus vanleenenianus TaxID=2268995 RepID=UPI003EC9E536
MSIPTVFSANGNCKDSPNGSLGGGGMARFCSNFNPRYDDICEIKTQEDYNEFQLGCVNYQWGTFVDNNNNTVFLEKKEGYAPFIEKAIEFPIGSHNNYFFLPAPEYEPPYPLYIGKENCLKPQEDLIECSWGVRPEWAVIEYPVPKGYAFVTDEQGIYNFADCCVNTVHGTFVNTFNISITVHTSPPPPPPYVTPGYTDTWTPPLNLSAFNLTGLFNYTTKTPAVTTFEILPQATSSISEKVYSQNITARSIL